MTTAREVSQEKWLGRQRAAAPRETPLWRNRQDHGLTLRDVSVAVGVAFSDISRAERGDVAPRVTTALRLARFYETTVEELFGWMLDDETQP